jgi:hypothetical protein
VAGYVVQIRYFCRTDHVDDNIAATKAWNYTLRCRQEIGIRVGCDCEWDDAIVADNRAGWRIY